jgi:hypothetical protein
LSLNRVLHTRSDRLQILSIDDADSADNRPDQFVSYLDWALRLFSENRIAPTDRAPAPGGTVANPVCEAPDVLLGVFHGLPPMGTGVLYGL